MCKKISLFFLLILSACSSNPTPSPQQSFYDKNLFFDAGNETERFPCPTTGEIPPWLCGTLLRNGPAKFQAGDKRVSSWLDGLAMLHAFTFTPHEVLYTNRFLRSRQYYQMVVEKKLNFTGFDQDPCSEAFKHQVSMFVPEHMQNIENAVINIAKYADKMVALTETPLPVIFDKETLDTLDAFTYTDSLPNHHIFESAHPLRECSKQETVNYLTRFDKKSSYMIWTMKDHHADRELLAEIPVDLPSYMHSFAVTEHYVVLAQFPFVVNPVDLMKQDKPFIQNYHWQPQLGTVFLVIDRSNGKLVSKIRTDSFFAFHHVNAFDKDKEIVIDIVTYPNADVISFVTGRAKLGKEELTTLKRFTVSIDSQKITEETLFDKPLEMPRVPSALTGHPYRYCYAVDYRFPSSDQTQRPLYKIDLTTKTSLSWFEEGCFPGEPIFVPHPTEKGEDSGVVLSVVLDFIRHRSFLLILDAQNFKEIARAEAPYAIPVGLHGQWSDSL